MKTPARAFEERQQSLVEVHARSSGSLVFDNLKLLLSELDIPESKSSRYHTGWAFEGPYSKPKPSPAFDGIPFELKMPSLNEMRARIDRIESERLPRSPYQKSIVLCTFNSTPGWGVMPRVKVSLALDITLANVFLAS